MYENNTKKLAGQENFSFLHLMTISGYAEIIVKDNSNLIAKDLVLIGFTPDYDYKKTFTMQLNIGDLWDIAYALKLLKQSGSSNYERITKSDSMKKITLGLKESTFYINGENGKGLKVAIGFSEHKLPGVIKKIENVANETTRTVYHMQRSIDSKKTRVKA